MNKVIKASFASVVSELQQSDIFMTVKARLFETPKANLNGVRVTPAFLDEVVKNEEKYVGLPLVADVTSLANGRYDRLGHLYDEKTGQFHTTQIGSFYKFEREDFDGGAYLVGYARIAKRNKCICRAVTELFAENALKFSFEISCGEYTKHDDGTTEIDVAESNFLEGEAIVSFPACEDAVALELVAECDRIADAEQKGDDKMDNMTNINETNIAAEEAEKIEEEQTEVEQTEGAQCCNKKKNAEEVQAAKEAATVYVTEEHHESDTVNVYDSTTGVEITESTSTNTVIRTQQEDVGMGLVAEIEETSEQTDVNQVVAEEDGDGDGDGEEGDDGDDMIVNVEDENKIDENIIAELRASIEELKREIAELLEQKTVVAEANPLPVNPFISEVNDEMNVKHAKYSLLEKANAKQNYSLLEKY